ncbi:MAG: MGMT family protein [Candidatus Poribacteria bacterium]
MAVKFTIFETEMGWIGIAGTKKGIRRAILPQPDKESAYMDIINLEDYDKEWRMYEFARLFPEDAQYAKILEKVKSLKIKQPDWMAKIKEALINYFKGQKIDFPFLLDLSGWTDFQRSVWEVTKSIPYGELRSYGWVAQQIGNPKSARAVGQAVGANPIPIIIPCHRVVASDGSLHGFTGGLHLKEKLIALERESAIPL